MDKTARPLRRRRWLWALPLLLLVPLLAIGALLLVKADVVAEKVKTRVLPMMSERLGREVTAGEVELGLFPPRVSVSDAKIAGGPNEPAFLEAGELSAGVQLWPLLRSLGKDVEVEEIVLHAPTLHLVRRADGTWSHEEISENAERNAPPAGDGVGRGSAAREVSIGSVRIEDGVVKLIDHTSGGDELAITDLDASASDIAFGKPLVVETRAAVLSAAQNFTGTFELDELPAELGGAQQVQLPKLSGRFSVQGVPLSRLEPFMPSKLGELITGGAIKMEGSVATAGDGSYTLSGPVTLQSLRLRGQPSDGRFDLHASAHPDDFERMRFKLDGVQLAGPGINLGGTASMTTNPDDARFALKGPLLDLEQLLGVRPADEEAKGAAGEAKVETALVSPRVRAALKGVTVRGTLEVDKVVNGKLSAQNLEAQASLVNGLLTVERGDADLYGGRVELGGTTMNLLAPQPKWSLKANVTGMNLAEAMGTLSQQQPLQGAMTMALTATGVGNQWTEVSRQVTGKGLFEIKEGALLSADLGEKIAGPLSQALAKLGAGRLSKVVAENGTQLRDLSATFSIKDGFLALNKPLVANTPFGTLNLGGRIGLDKRLDLTGTVLLEPEFVAQVTGGRVRPDKPVELPLGIGGTLAAPAISRIDTGALLVKNLPMSKAQEAVEDRAEKVEDQVKRQARKKLEGLLRR